MKKLLQDILDWSEVWVLLIPLIFMLRWKPQLPYLKPIRIYIWVSIFLHLIINVIWRFKNDFGFQEGDLLSSNNFIYNIVSIVRFLLFSWFFILLGQPFLARVKKIIPLLFVIFLIINFLFFEDFFYYWSFSGKLLSLETGLLLLYCLQYYFFVLNEEHSSDKRPPSFWVVTGLSIYVVINFPIFLFYRAFLKQFENFAVNIWDITNISFILFCLFISKAFYESKH